MKQVIIVDATLEMPPGKLAAQVAHASVGAYVNAPYVTREAWLAAGMPKIVLRAEGQEALLRLEEAARAQGVPVCLVRDAGRTVLPAGTITCVGIGPALAARVDPVTGRFPLLR